MNKLDGKKFLVTTDDSFIGPDGRVYISVWGEVQVLDDNVLGVETNKNSTNWFLWVGDDEHGMLIAGCRIHYAVRCEEPPPSNVEDEKMNSDGSLVTYQTKYGRAYIAQEVE